MNVWSPPDLDQPQDGYRFTSDAFILAAFARAFAGPRWCDLGTGSGVIAHQLAQFIGGEGYAVERQAALIPYARHNLAGAPVTLIEGDLTCFPWQGKSLDLVVCNPPYYEVGAGHINRSRTKAEARHTFYGGVREFADVIWQALSDSGYFCFVFPFDLHQRPLRDLQKRGWCLQRRLLVRSFEGRQPKLICLALSKQPQKTIEECDINIYQSHRVHTDELQTFLITGRLPRPIQYLDPV